MSAARSPLAKRDINVTPNVGVKLLPENKASLDIHMRIEAKKPVCESSGRYRDLFRCGWIRARSVGPTARGL